jgi:cation:H+ antiporter
VRRRSRAHAHDDPQRKRSLATTCLLTAAAAGAILAAGFVLAGTGEALAEQTGLGASFVGMLLGGIATSLPEVSTLLRMGIYSIIVLVAYSGGLVVLFFLR